MKMTGQAKTIASIFPFPLPELLRPYGAIPIDDSPVHSPGCTIYRIEPCKDDHKPSTTVVYDSFQVGIDPETRKSSYNKTQFVRVNDIARDLVDAHWSVPMHGAPSNCGPGVWICESDVPTESEIEAARQRQHDYATWLWNTAERAAFEAKWVEIQPLHIAMIKWLGKTPTWMPAMETREIPRCPWCQTQVSPMAYICSGCHNVMKELPPEFVKYNPQFHQAHQGGPMRPPLKN